MLYLKTNIICRYLPTMFVGTSKERFFFHNTLVCLVEGLQGHNITVDLRNDACVCGNVDSVDGYMNITFTNSVYCNPRGEEFSFENLYIQSRNIRYVHIPQQIPIKETIEKEIKKGKKPKPEKPTQKSRKVKKAMKQHLQTVASLDI